MNFDLSVVVAVWDSTEGLRRCLASLRPQCDERTEVIVSSNVPTPADLRNEEASIRWLLEDRRCLIPQLWARGMSCATGDVIAITTAHFRPAPDWIAKIRELHRRYNDAGIGGAIDPPSGGNLVDWATYFLRYSSTLHLRQEQPVDGIAGDNAAYKRQALDDYRTALDEGFWEPDFHRLLRTAGQTLRYSPEIRVTQHASFGVRPFCEQRRRHGRQFGASRVRGKRLQMKVLRAASAPLIPLVLLGKVVGRVLASRRDVGSLLLSLPLIAVFVCAWTVGEVQGYLSLGDREDRRAEDRLES